MINRESLPIAIAKINSLLYEHTEPIVPVSAKLLYELRDALAFADGWINQARVTEQPPREFLGQENGR